MIGLFKLSNINICIIKSREFIYRALLKITSVVQCALLGDENYNQIKTQTYIIMKNRKKIFLDKIIKTQQVYCTLKCVFIYYTINTKKTECKLLCLHEDYSRISNG